MSDADLLLDAIWANPDDDTPRLVYADWLQEHGYEDYAHYIRLSIRIAREMQHPDERARLRHERYLLGAAIMKAHPRAFPEYGYALHYAQSNFGIATAYHETDADDFLENSAHWWPFLRPKMLMLRAVTFREQALGQCDYLRRITALECEGRVDEGSFEVSRENIQWHPISGTLIRTLLNNSGFDALRALEVQPIEATATQLLRLGDSRLAEQLEELHLWVQFPDGSREDLRARKEHMKEEITAFVTEHMRRFDPR